ncbi:NAD(P)/FAD-dependent oxidoreductase [Bacillus sp. B1-b2]|uniref:NAD(P)/FAD-dependent oxidoreductase n=1 Tax=Bacillus sp. B1-b2 TaxID=2653201 RepID=UPI0012625054|nr:NAD(P)/FAD-dependent oxidoreductase [Bacillus sp. B1-b2]KAB7666480.1 NAD(P)/FAD-dependent oxidoreductase [Bacillus sp. B1-b2]
MKKLVILGGGYGGMRLLSLLIPNLPYNILVVLIDKVPFHFLKTEYYAIAAGTVTDSHVTFPFPNHPQVTIIQQEVESINLNKQIVHLAEGNYMEYDDLVIGLGCEDNYHQVPGANQFTQSIQTIYKSKQSYKILQSLSDGEKVAIIGAGLSGVELAAELAESTHLDISLFDRGSSILSSYPPKVSSYVEKWLKENQVHLIKQSNITLIEENMVYNHDSPIPFSCMIWTAGVKPNSIVRSLDVEKDAKERVILNSYHHLPDDEHVFVVGDCASLNHPPSAQLAEGQAEQIATILISRWKGKLPPQELPPIKIKGVLGSLGKKHGFGLIFNTALTGRIPRLMKHGVLWKDRTKKSKYY